MLEVLPFGRGGARRLGNRNVIVALLVAAAVLLGGGGSPFPMPELCLQLLGLAALVAWALIDEAPLPRADWRAWLICGLLLGVPLLQLVPLPPQVWHALPGREVERASLALVGAENGWEPLSVAPARTLSALLAVTTPAVLLVMTAALGQAGRSMAMAMIAALALVTLLLGAVQLAGGHKDLFQVYGPGPTHFMGLQANHNSTADVLLIGMVALVATLREWGAGRGSAVPVATLLAFAAGMATLISLGVVLTASRAGIALLPVAWGAVAGLLMPWVRSARSRRRFVLPAGVVLGGIALALVLSSGVVGYVVRRFDFTGEMRPQIWHDALAAAAQYFPWGSGTGSFVPVFVAAEPLDSVARFMPPEAHNELIGITMESGILGMVIAVTITTVLLDRAWRSSRTPPVGSLPQVWFGATTIAIIALHSQVDYPLRSMSLACIAAVAAGMLMPGGAEAAENQNSYPGQSRDLA